MAVHWIFFAVFYIQLVLFYPIIKASGIAEIKLENFSNPTGKLFGGDCCDYKNFWSHDCASCDHQFVVCLGNLSQSSDMNSCEFGKVTTGKLKSNQIEFTKDIGGVSNPIKLKFKTWPGFMKIKINTLDIDGLDTFDFVDHYEYQYFTPGLKKRKYSTPLTLNLIGSSTRLKLELRVHCDDLSFGPTCEIVCIPRDDEKGHYFCDLTSGEKKCFLGWTGDDCTQNIDDCKNHECQSGATCQDGIGLYTCLCPLGRTGRYCEGEINECASLPCLNGGSCYDEMAAFRCSCKPSYTGDRCEKLISACDSQPCHNNATCYSESIDDFNCTCIQGTSGSYCEIDNDECASNYCQNNATCIDQLNDYECLCLPGYKGIMCQLDINECGSNPCQNGGVCQDLPNNFKCICGSGTTGRTCENDINECLREPCSGNGNCTNLIGSFRCSCFPGFVGEHCDWLDPCFSSPCDNNGSCLPLDKNSTDGNYKCACAPGFNGTNCKSDVDECAESRVSDTKLCRNGGSCVNIVGSFQCDCHSGFTGPKCEIMSNDKTEKGLKTVPTTTFKRTTRVTRRNRAKTTVSPFEKVTGTTLPSNDVSESSQVNSGDSFDIGENLVVEAHIPIALTTKNPTLDIVTDCVLIKIFGVNKPDLKPEDQSVKKEICWLVYASIPPPVVDVDLFVTSNKDEAYRWISKTLVILTPVAPRPTDVEKEKQMFLRNSQMLLTAFSRYRSTGAHDNSTLNSDCLQILIKTKRKGYGYYKKTPNNPYVRYVRRFKPLLRSLASKMIVCKAPEERTSTTTVRTTTRRTTLIRKLQTTIRAPSSVKTPVKTFRVVISNFNNTHTQRKFYYPERGYHQENTRIVAPRLVVTIYRSARKILDAGHEKARQVHQETKVLLNKTLRQLSTLWTTVHRISNVMYIPVAHTRDRISETWNAAWLRARGAYSAAREVVHRAYQQARENFRKVYDRLKERASRVSTRYYQLYRNYYRDYTKQVSKAAEIFANTYDNYALYLTQYWKKYMKGEQNVDVRLPSQRKENPFTGPVRRFRKK